MNKKIKKILPAWLIALMKFVFVFVKRIKIRRAFYRMYRKDMIRFLKHSRTLSNNNSSKMIGAIIMQYHVIEKGLSMPETRLGFGTDRIISLCKACIEYINKFGLDDDQVSHAVAVVLEYENYHKKENYKINDSVIEYMNKLKKVANRNITESQQTSILKNNYFKYSKGSYPEFSNSRSSVRNFSLENLSIDKIHDSIELARNTPSACNRQSWRTYVFAGKNKILKILDLQGGNRGFGHKVNKLIVISGELGVFCNTNERNQVYVDGGMYAMNLLYALHYNEIAACILNCSFDFSKETEIKRLCDIRDSEVLIAMIACGEAPDEFKIASSPRYQVSITNKIISE